MNPYTNRFESLSPMPDHMQKEMRSLLDHHEGLVRPDGSPVPSHWKVFTVGETVDVNGHSFRIAGIGEQSMLLEPAGTVIVGAPAEATTATNRHQRRRAKALAKQG